MHLVLVSLGSLAGARGPLLVPTLECDFLRLNYAHWRCLYILLRKFLMFSQLHGVINPIVSRFHCCPRGVDGHIGRGIVDVGAVEELLIMSCRAVVVRRHLFFNQMPTI